MVGTENGRYRVPLQISTYYGTKLGWHDLFILRDRVVLARPLYITRLSWSGTASPCSLLLSR